MAEGNGASARRGGREADGQSPPLPPLAPACSILTRGPRYEHTDSYRDARGKRGLVEDQERKRPAGLLAGRLESCANWPIPCPPPRQISRRWTRASWRSSSGCMEPRSRKSSTPSTTPPRRSPAKPPPSPCRSARQNCAASPEPWRQTEPPSRVPAQNPCRMPTPLQAQTCPPRARSLMGIHHRTSRRWNTAPTSFRCHESQRRRLDKHAGRRLY